VRRILASNIYRSTLQLRSNQRRSTYPISTFDNNKSSY